MLKKLLKGLLLLIFIYAVARFVIVFEDSRLAGDRAPYIQMLTTNSVIIHWLTDSEQLGVVRYGRERKHITRIELDEDTTTDHIVQLTELLPATLYYYQVGDSSGFNEFEPEKHWFKTYPEGTVPTRVWVMGDTGEPGEILNHVRDAAFAWMKNNPVISADGSIRPVVAGEPGSLFDIWLALGDIAYRSGTNAQYQVALFEPFAEVLPNVAILPVYGNHDERRWTYFRIFDLPENAEAGGLASGTENYYSVDYSNIHFVVLDSQDSGLAVNGKMAVWLKDDLAQNTKPWTVVAFHHPPYTKGSHDSDDDSDSGGRMQEMRQNILPILENAGVDLVLSGHSHMYERSYLMDCAYGSSDEFSAKNIVSSGVDNKQQQFLKPLDVKQHQGTVYVVMGSSSKVDRGPLDHPANYVGLQEAGSVVIDVVDNKLTTRFINDKGLVKDSFSISKVAGYESGYKGCQ